MLPVPYDALKLDGGLLGVDGIGGLSGATIPPVTIPKFAAGPPDLLAIAWDIPTDAGAASSTLVSF